LLRPFRRSEGQGDYRAALAGLLRPSVFLCLALLPGSAAVLGAERLPAQQAPHPAPEHPTATQAAPSGGPASESQAAADIMPAYLVAPGDVLKILVWKEPELSTEAFVRLDGRVTVPLLGDVMAAGRTPDDLSMEIQAKLGRFLEVPQVTLAVSQAISARFYVLGEVAHPGAYPLPRRVSVVQALALAGGFREFAKKDSIRILRQQGEKQIAIPFNYKEVEIGVRLEQDIFLDAGDTIVVP